jgi:light-regulated signal transduction histidine kinase (bacteriophytochrome)
LLIGSDFAGYFTDPERARAGYREAYARGSVRDYPLSLKHRSGDTMDVVYNATLYRDAEGAIAGLFAAARDVTARNKAENELRQQHEHLEQMVRERTADLAATNAKLESANTELESFAYSVSHDLRTPLRAIDGFSVMLLEDYGPKLDAEGQRIINVVRDSTVKMTRMIEDILAYSRAGRVDQKRTQLDMEALVRAVVKELEALAPGRKLSIAIGALPPALADGPMMQRVWTNLIDNAIKYSGQKPEARIEIGAIPGAGETVYFVRDNGAGFDMQYVGKLFGVFQRLHGADFAGTGIGLAIVKRIVTRHGGRVWAEGKPDQGATFYFALPQAASGHA